MVQDKQNRPGFTIAAIFAAIVCGIFVFTSTTLKALGYNPNSSEVQNEMPKEVGKEKNDGIQDLNTKPILDLTKTQEATSSQFPTNIEIPRIGINAEIKKIGITFKGNVGAPYEYDTVGWYKYGAIPGQNGNAFLDGHVDNGLGWPGVFSNIKNLKQGDKIYITMNSGERLSYSVTSVERFYYKDVPMAELLKTSSLSTISLMTCDGEWLPEYKTDDHRIVVMAVLDK